jgi:hypothetical protein
MPAGLLGENQVKAVPSKIKRFRGVYVGKKVDANGKLDLKHS